MSSSVHTHGYAALRAELRSARAAAGLSQRDLAARLGVPRSWIANVETGERRIDAVELCWFVAACGAEPVEVFARVARQTAPPARPARRGGRR